MKLYQHRIQPLELFLKKTSIPLQPTIDLVEWLRAKGVDPTLSLRPYLHKTGITQRSKMLGRLRLSHPKPLGDGPHRKRLTKQKVEDLETAWFSERSESFEHSPGLFHNENIPVKEYKLFGFFNPEKLSLVLIESIFRGLAVCADVRARIARSRPRLKPQRSSSGWNRVNLGVCHVTF